MGRERSVSECAFACQCKVLNTRRAAMHLQHAKCTRKMQFRRQTKISLSELSYSACRWVGNVDGFANETRESNKTKQSMKHCELETKGNGAFLPWSCALAKRRDDNNASLLRRHPRGHQGRMAFGFVLQKNKNIMKSKKELIIATWARNANNANENARKT